MGRSGNPESVGNHSVAALMHRIGLAALDFDNKTGI
jgi:hypothetical protein